MKRLILLLLSLYPLIISAAELPKDTLEVVEITSGGILDNLPYGKPFYITGIAKDDLDNPVDLIELKITTNNHKKCDTGNFDDLIYATYWDARDKKKKGKYKILIPKRLQFMTCYKVQVDYFKTAELSGGDFATILEDIIKKYTAKEGPEFTGSIGALTEELLDQTEAGIVNSLESLGKYDLVQRGKDSLKLVKFSELPAWVYDANNPDGLVFNIASIVKTEEAIKKEEVTKNKLIKELEKLRKDSLPSFPALKKALDELEDTSNGELISEEEIKNIESFFMKGDLTNTIFINFFAVRDSLKSKPAQRSLFRKIQKSHKKNDLSVKDINKFKKSIKVYEKAMEKDKKAVNAYVLVEQRTSANSASFPSTSSIEKIKFSSPVGFGASLLNPGDGITEFNGLAYLGLRYYFFAVDKGLVSNPYLNRNKPFNRMSFVLGFMLGKNYEYRGEPLKNAFLVKPVFGLGYDIDRFITIDVGVIGFKIDSTHPFTSDSAWKFAPQVGLSLELDVFNRVNSSFKKGPSYKIE